MFEKYSEEEYEEMFQKVKECIKSNPRAKEQFKIVVEETGVPIEVIKKFIKEKRLDVIEGLDIEKLKKYIDDERKKQLIQGMQKQIEEINKKEERYKEGYSSSKLYNDLKDKYDKER